MPEKLKPCPFCGFKRPKIRRFNTNAYRVVCQRCGSQGAPCQIHKWHDSVYVAQGNAIKIWNRRKLKVTCKDCIHYDICLIRDELSDGESKVVSVLECEHFTDRSRFVELPCLIKPRDKVWYILEGLSEVDLKEYAIKSGECAVGNEPDTVIEVGTLGFWVNQLSTRNENCPFPDYCDFISWDEIGKSYFLSKEEAEQALKERDSNAGRNDT